MKRINYDFSEFEFILFSIKTEGATSAKLYDLRNELNSFFKDSKCREVIYTENTDKLFFGMSVIPYINDDDTVKILQTDDPYRIDSYYIELDSKLFSPILGLSKRELVAILLHEVGHIVNDTKPIDETRKAIDVYMAKNNDNIVISDSVHYREILAFAIKDSVRKFVSMFEFKDSEIIADEFVSVCGYGNELESSFRKLINNSYIINKNVNDKLIILSWVLRLYKDVKLRRIPAIRALNKGKSLTASRLEKREIENVIRRLNRIDDDALLESVLDDLKNKYNATLREIKYKGVRALEDDLYEYNMRIRNTDDEEDALFLMRQINTRISIIDDYISTEKLEEKDQKRWFETLSKFKKLRDELSKKATYKNKYMDIFVSYPEIKQNNY